MREEIFRKKSLDKVKSPENLDDYIRVSNPGVWLLLLSVIILLAGVCVWGVFGHIDSTVDANVHAENGTLICIVDDQSISAIQTGMIVKFGGFEAVITGIRQDDGVYSCVLQTDQAVLDGFYKGKVVVKSYNPLSFILN